MSYAATVVKKTLLDDLAASFIAFSIEISDAKSLWEGVRNKFIPKGAGGNNEHQFSSLNITLIKRELNESFRT